MGSMIRGSDPQDIAQDLDLDIRSVYAYKQRIEKRMGRKLNSLFIDSHPVTREQPSPLPAEKGRPNSSSPEMTVTFNAYPL